MRIRDFFANILLVFVKEKQNGCSFSSPHQGNRKHWEVLQGYCAFSPYIINLFLE